MEPPCRVATAAAAPAQTVYDELLQWVLQDRPRLVAVQDVAGRGRGLVAQADLGPGQVLISVPLNQVFMSQMRA